MSVDFIFLFNIHMANTSVGKWSTSSEFTRSFHDGDACYQNGEDTFFIILFFFYLLTGNTYIDSGSFGGLY